MLASPAMSVMLKPFEKIPLSDVWFMVVKMVGSGQEHTWVIKQRWVNVLG